MKPHIFISYSSSDIEFVRRLYSVLLSTKAINVWHDNLGIRTGDQLNETIEKAIEIDTNVCLFYLSESALKSEWVKREYELAMKKRPLIVYFFVDCAATRQKLYLLSPELSHNSKRIPVINEDEFHEPLLEFVSTLLSKFAADLHPGIDIDNVLSAASTKGIASIQHGRFTKDDDDRMEKLIVGAQRIRVLMSNANKFLDIFKRPLIEFMSKEGATFELLLADEKSVFYNENSCLISPVFNNDPSNQELVLFAIKRARAILHDAGGNASLNIRKYNTQFRLPLIIFDEETALLTINLPPSESSDGMTIELVDGKREGYLSACLNHFEAIWVVSADVGL